MRIAQRHFRRLERRNGVRGLEACFAVEALGRWVRVGLFYGEAPGSNMMGRHAAFWQTRCDDLHGWNLRFGWWPRPCVSLLLHTRPVRHPGR